AADLDAGLGFFCHAFADSVLQEPGTYRDALRDLARSLADLSTDGSVSGGGFIALEQMYSPHQVPWTISGAEELLREVYRQTLHSSPESVRPCYITIDTGHAGAQRRFVRPDRERLGGLIAEYREGRRVDNVWLGPRRAYAVFDEATDHESGDDITWIEQIEREMGMFPYLFAHERDGDLYAWLERLGRYSPIIHLQQTSGKSSAHLPFTLEHNRSGIITGNKVLQALGVSCSGESVAGMPPGCGEIFLTIEMFSGTSDMNVDILHRLKESAAYWRQFIPEDGLRLSELLNRLDKDDGVHDAH
ncbi:MAG TPA: hypothetical protein VMW87_04055, partial [Spirochaetia bacterium]|nr:hypothetical protein [Spirochaetia bacterium]